MNMSVKQCSSGQWQFSSVSKLTLGMVHFLYATCLPHGQVGHYWEESHTNLVIITVFFFFHFTCYLVLILTCTIYDLKATGDLIIYYIFNFTKRYIYYLFWVWYIVNMKIRNEKCLSGTRNGCKHEIRNKYCYQDIRLISDKLWSEICMMCCSSIEIFIFW